MLVLSVYLCALQSALVSLSYTELVSLLGESNPMLKSVLNTI